MPYKDKTCIECKVVYAPTSSSQKACAVCKAKLRAADNVQRLRKMRADKGATAVNSIKPCIDCGNDFLYKSGPQVRCAECQRVRKLETMYRWMASNLDQVAKYRKKSKDNYDFGGNRQKALERDGYACLHCGTADDLCIHHIDGNGTTSPRELRNNSLDNLMTLCRACHTRVHHSN